MKKTIVESFRSPIALAKYVDDMKLSNSDVIAITNDGSGNWVLFYFGQPETENEED